MADAYPIRGPRSRFPGTMIVESSSGKCIDAGAGTDGTNLTLRTCNPSPIIGVGSNPTPIIGVGSRRCLDIPWGDAVDGAPLQIADCNGSGAQQWTFEMDGSVRALGKCMDVAWGATHNGTVIQLANCSGNLAQQFVLTSAGDFVNPQSGKCVDVGWATADGSRLIQCRLIQWECHGAATRSSG